MKKQLYELKIDSYLSEKKLDLDKYKKVQEDANKQFFSNTWAMEENIEFLSRYIKKTLKSCSNGLCHGVRNGAEVEWFIKYLNCEIIGTDISETANNIKHLIQWDFHELKDEWINRFDFIYSNSFDHSYNPELCLNNWIKCLKPGGICILEHSDMHSEKGVTDLDPFGADIAIMPYLITKWANKNYYVLELLKAPKIKTGIEYLEFIVIKKNDLRENSEINFSYTKNDDDILRDYLNIFTHMTKDELYKLLELSSGIFNGTMLEIGSYIGASSNFIAHSCLKTNSKLYCVDTWQNDAMTEGKRDTFTEFLQNTYKLGQFITPVRMKSIDACSNFSQSLDLIFFDGDHSYDGISSDWNYWRHKLNDSAIVIFHDFGWAEGVKRVIAEDVEPYCNDIGKLPNMWWGRFDKNKFNNEMYESLSLKKILANRDINKILDDFRNLNVNIYNYSVDVNDFKKWLQLFPEIDTRYKKSGDVYIEKCLEHYLATVFLKLKPGDTYIDVASAGSNFADLLIEKGIQAFKLDLSYQDGIIGNQIGADASNTNLPDNSIDSMSLQCAFECFQGDSDYKFIIEAERILKENGKVVICPLYIDNEYFIITSKECDQTKIEFDEKALKVWRDDQYQEPFSRHYSPTSFFERILSKINKNNNVNLYYISNLDSLRSEFKGQRIYCDFVFVLEKNAVTKSELLPDPKLSIIIPTRNRANYLDNTLKSIMNQSIPKSEFEILIIDNGSTDNTKDIVFNNKFKNLNIRYFYEEEPGLHVGRHRGMIESKSDLLVFIDDDIEAFPNWLEGIVESFESPEVVIVGGKNLPKWETTPPDWIMNMWLQKNENGQSLAYLSILDFGNKLKVINPIYIWGLNFSIRKNILIEAGGFHPDGMPQELIKYRGDGESYVSQFISLHGYKSLYNPKASVYHIIPSERLTIEYFMKRAFNQGVSDSYTYIRKNRKPLDHTFSKEIRQKNINFMKIDQSYIEGYNYHNNETKNDVDLLNWVLKDKYYHFENEKTQNSKESYDYSSDIFNVIREFSIPNHNFNNQMFILSNCIIDPNNIHDRFNLWQIEIDNLTISNKTNNGFNPQLGKINYYEVSIDLQLIMEYLKFLKKNKGIFLSTNNSSLLTAHLKNSIHLLEKFNSINEVRLLISKLKENIINFTS